jgi:hypothetical protein
MIKGKGATVKLSVYIFLLLLNCLSFNMWCTLYNKVRRVCPPVNVLPLTGLPYGQKRLLYSRQILLPLLV